MTITEAIEILRAILTSDYHGNALARHDAFCLAIEALKRTEWRRRQVGSWDDALLPGETE